jgi:hypothetical protein
MFGGFKHQKKNYNDYSKEAKEGVNIINNYIYEVLANKCKDKYDYLIKWYANVIQGNKNETALYLKGPQGIGKSTISDFLRLFVLGKDITLKCGNATTLTEKFNSILMGKIFVVYEELPTFTTNQWCGVSGVLKDRITSKDGLYEAKGKDPIEADNINNYQINSNVEAIKNSDGRRFFILDLCTTKKRDYKFWNNLHSKCFNDVVGEAYYNFLCEVDVSNFHSEKDMPQTENKKDSHVSNLHIEYQFLKDEFILKKKNMNHILTELFEMFQSYCATHNKTNFVGKPYAFREKLIEINLEAKKSKDGKRRPYIYSYQELEEIFKSNHWMHELDYERAEYEQKKQEKSDSEDDENVQELKTELKNLKESYDELYQKYITLQKQLEQQKEVKEEPKEDNLVCYSCGCDNQNSFKTNKIYCDSCYNNPDLNNCSSYGYPFYCDKASITKGCIDHSNFCSQCGNHFKPTWDKICSSCKREKLKEEQKEEINNPMSQTEDTQTETENVKERKECVQCRKKFLTAKGFIRCRKCRIEHKVLVELEEEEVKPQQKQLIKRKLKKQCDTDEEVENAINDALEYYNNC